MKKNKIILTAGHHLKDSGATALGRQENEEAIKDRDLLKEAIHFINPKIQVVIDDDNDRLSTVIRKINEVGSRNDILLDIHYNSASVVATGVEAFVKIGASETSVRTAKRIVEVFSKMMGIPNRGVKLENQSQHPRLGILHTTDHAVLLEVGFITNKEEMERVEEFRDRLWIAVANILIQERLKLT